MTTDVNTEFKHFVALCVGTRSTVDAKRFIEVNKAMVKWFARKFGSDFLMLFNETANSFKASRKDIDIDMVELERDLIKTIKSK